MNDGEVIYCHFFSDCRNTLEGMEYMGRRSVTLSGLTCQRWDEQTPHRHPYKDVIDKRFPDQNIVDAANFCRNPDGKDTGPWCYTTDPGTEWETCQVPICSGRAFSLRDDRQISQYLLRKSVSGSVNVVKLVNGSYFSVLTL